MESKRDEPQESVKKLRQVGGMSSAQCCAEIDVWFQLPERLLSGLCGLWIFHLR